MLPADAILRAAQRWIQLLSRSSFTQAAALIKADPAYTDLSQTQYANALDWLRSTGLLIETNHGPAVEPSVLHLSGPALRQLLFSKALEAAAPPWLADADTLVDDEDELPQDATRLAQVLELDDRQALVALRQLHGRIDLAERARVGAAGEAALVAILEEQWPGSTRHASLEDDGLGYDIAFRPTDIEYHLEVKSTTRRGRLTIFLSRHEHEIAQLDSRWHLIVIGLDTDGQAAAIATATESALLARSPLDRTPAARWESVRHHLTADDLDPGLHFDDAERPSSSLLTEGGSRTFAWMPRALAQPHPE